MQLTLYGINYTLKPNASTSKFISLLNDEDTYSLYITTNRKKHDDFDVILLINIEKRELFPMFLSVFNDLVEPYYVPLIQTFPEMRIVESNAIDYTVCSMASMAIVPKYTDNKYIAYGTVGKMLYICPNKKIDFLRFGTTKLESIEEPTSPERTMIYEETIRRPVTNDSVSRVSSYRPTEHKTPVEQRYTPTQLHSQPKPKQINQIPTVVPPKVEKVAHVPSRDNLFRFCGYQNDMIVVHLVYTNELAFIDKELGSVRIVAIDDILSNPMIGYNDTTMMIRQFGKVTTIAQEVVDIVITDIRSAIRMLESRKEMPVTKQMFAYSNKQLYVAFASEQAFEEQITIKNFAISCHRDSQALYEKLKEKTMTYSKDVYFIATEQDCGIVAISSDPKKPIPIQYILLDKVYASTNAKNIGDIMRMFPIDKIIDGYTLGIDSISRVKNIAIVSNDVLKLVAKKYESRNIIFSYDPSSQTIMKSN